MLEAKPVNDIANIDKIDIQKTFEKILYVPKYCYSLLKAIEEELAGKPLPEIPKDGMAYMMWHTEGLVAYTSIPFYAEYSVTPEKLIPFVKLSRTQQRRILYRAVVLCEWWFDGIVTPLTLSLNQG